MKETAKINTFGIRKYSRSVTLTKALKIIKAENDDCVMVETNENRTKIILTRVK